jgi:hypothetical protein
MHESKACPWKKKLHKKEFFSFLEKEIKRPCFESHSRKKQENFDHPNEIYPEQMECALRRGV